LELALNSPRVTDIIRIMDRIEFAMRVIQRFIKRYGFSGIRLPEEAHPLIVQ
jgi:hypothetical protein